MKRLLVVVALAFVISVSICGTKAKACYTDSGKVLEYMTLIRAEFGLPSLAMDDTLKEAASVRAVELSECFSHTRPDGSAWHTAGAGLAGENLARAINDEQSKSLNIAYAWYLSPGHSANLLCSRYTKAGISYYEKDGITYIACEFN